MAQGNLATAPREEFLVADSMPLMVERALLLLWLGVFIEFARAMVVFDYSQANAMTPALKASLELAATLGLSAWLNVKIGSRRNWARMTLLCLYVLGAIPSVVIVMQTMATSKVSGVAYVAETALGIAALALLFTKPARDWFAGI